MLSSQHESCYKKIELYENERYNPITKWSKGGLLPTDRKYISTANGTNGWTTWEEVSNAITAYGWMWELGSDWSFESSDNYESESHSIEKKEPTNENQKIMDKDWKYATDFSSFINGDSGSDTKGMMHFVRRRKLFRIEYFDVNTIYPDDSLTCDYCDSKELSKLTAIFLEKLAQASLTRHPRQLSLTKLCTLKKAFVDILQLRSNSEKNTTIFSSSSTGITYSFETIYQILEDFANSNKTALSIASSVLTTSSSSADTLSNRITELSSSASIVSFDYHERYSIAKLLIRKWDQTHTFHCNKKNCSSSNECIFAPETCPHDGCGEVYSRKWSQEHDDICPHKILLCTRSCGDSCTRCTMTTHLQEFCILRPVQCPFQDIGCDVKDLVYRDYDEHLHSFQNQHMLLSLSRLQEHEKVIASLYKRIGELEVMNQQQLQHLGEVEHKLAGAVVALKLSETRNERLLQDQINRLDAKISSKMSDHHSELKTSITQLKKGISDITRK